jgi:signal transduction histidine kinase
VSAQTWLARQRTDAGLSTRLLVAQAMVLMAGAATSWVVASLVAPGIFHDHLVEAGAGHSAAETVHIEEAFSSALIISMAVALLTSVLMALMVTGYFTRRVQRSTTHVSHAAARIAEGQFGARVPNPGLGPEFDQLATTINDLAERLGDVEGTRRRILADLAHEMRTPLATIEAHLEALEDGVRTLDEPTLAALHGGTQRLHRLAQDISAVSRAEEGQLDSRPVRTNPQVLLESAAAAAQDAYDAGQVRLAVEASGAVPDVHVDPERIGQVLANLLENALRHTPPGGSVRLSATRPDNHWVELDVTDTGEGITPEHLPHVFERFYRADPARRHQPGGSGSGIGLTISRALVEAHGGGLSVHSAGQGQGATFSIRLPAAHG